MNSNSLSEYDFDLPKELIANKPVVPRDSSRLLVFDKNIYDYNFFDLVDLLPENTVLIFNDTKVLKSRIIFEFNSRVIEVFFASQVNEFEFEVLCKPSNLFKIGSVIELPEGVKFEVISITDIGTRIIRILNTKFNYFEFLDKYGQIPLPPYIDLEGKDPNSFESQYQTVYSKNLGSVAAPTAGLHFTDELLARLKSKGIKVEFITLQVGLGTFMPIRSENIDEHNMHSEAFYISESAAKNINKYKEEGYKVIAVGTTTLRALQSVYDATSRIVAGYYDTDIFIKPGYSNWYIDALITNFHLPKSTLFILISAFVGAQNAKSIYTHAIQSKYRFYSFGDSSLLWLPNTK